MSKKLLFNYDDSIIDIPFESGSIGNTIIFPRGFSNAYFLKNVYLASRFELTYLTGEMAGEVIYEPSPDIVIKIKLYKKDGTLLFETSSSSVGNDTPYVLEDSFKLSSISNLKNIRIQIRKK